MLIVRCGCGTVVAKIDDGKGEMTETGGAECPPCFANEGNYSKSPNWEEGTAPKNTEKPVAENAQGKVINLHQSTRQKPSKRPGSTQRGRGE